VFPTLQPLSPFRPFCPFSRTSLGKNGPNELLISCQTKGNGEFPPDLPFIDSLICPIRQLQQGTDFVTLYLRETKVPLMKLKSIVLVLIAALSTFASASIEHAKNDQSLVWTREHNLIETMEKHNVIPVTRGKNDLVLIARIGGAYSEIILCAPPSGDAFAVAEIVNKAIDADQVKWNQEDDYAAVRMAWSRAHYFNYHGTNLVQIGKLVEALTLSGWKVSGCVATSKSASTNISSTPFSRNSSYNFYSLKDSPSEVRVEVSVSAFLTFLIFLIPFGPICVLLTGYLIALTYCRNPNIPADNRRKVYRFMIGKVVIGSICICLPIAIFLIGSGGLTPVGDLWFGSYGSSFMMPIVMITLPVIFLLLIPLSRLESRILSETPDKPNFVPSRVKGVSGINQKRQLMLTLPFFFGGTLIYSLVFILPQHSGISVASRFVGLFLMMFSTQIASFIVSRTKPLERPNETTEPAVLRAYDLAVRSQVNLLNISIIEPGDTKQTIGVSYMNNKLIITRKAIDELSAEALDFGVALALQDSMAVMIPIVLICVVAVALTLPVIKYATQHIDPSNRVFATFGIQFGMAFLIVPFTMKFIMLHQDRKLRKALALVPNAEAAREYITRSINQENRRLKRVTDRQLRIIDDFERNSSNHRGNHSE